MSRSMKNVLALGTVAVFCGLPVFGFAQNSDAPPSPSVSTASSNIRYQVVDDAGVERANGGFQIVIGDKVEFSVGGTKSSVTKAGRALDLSVANSANVNLRSEAGKISKEIEFNSDGSSEISSLDREGQRFYRIKDNFDGSGSIEIFQGDQVRYVLSIKASGEMSLTTPLSPPAVATRPAVAPVARPPATPTSTAPSSTTPASSTTTTPRTTP